MAADNISSSGRFADFTKFINSSNGGSGESGDPWNDSPLLTRRAGDHVCRPVIIHSDGRVTPVTDFTVLDALPPPHRHPKEPTPTNAGSRAQFQLPASTFGSLYGGGDAYNEGGRWLIWGDGREEEPAAVVSRGGWDLPEMGRTRNSFQAAAEFLWGSGKPAARAAASPPAPYTLQQGDQSPAVPAIDRSDAANKSGVGGEFVW